MKNKIFYQTTYIFLLLAFSFDVPVSQACTVPTNLTLNYTFTIATAGETVEVTWTSDCPAALMNISIFNVALWQTQQTYYNVPNTGSFMFAINPNIAIGESGFYIEDVGQNIWNYGPYFDLLGPLPVELSEFHAQRSDFDNTIDLTFKTASESNASHFEIQHSMDGQHFYEIGMLGASGESNIERTYHFTHTSPKNGDNYYRLKMVDRDGRYDYSAVESVYLDSKEQLAVFPNPSSGIFQIKGTSGQSVTVNVFDSFGKLVSERLLIDTNIDISAFPNGVYFIVLNMENQTFSSKVLKQD